MASPATWWERAHDAPGFVTAYFSPEFGVDASLPVYAGGLGILAGDHLKSAGDLGVPLVGVGLFYRQGYFRQSIEDGEQRERYPELDAEALGLTLERDSDDRPLLVEVRLAGETVFARIWHRDVRGTPLYLLDADAPENPKALRAVTDVLYGPDREHRIRQEMLLGVGGARALAALGVEPSVYHLNEGHAAFLSLERVRELVQERGLSFADALEHVRATTVFTTHTPVAAGNERFAVELARRYLAELAAGCGVGVEDILALGEEPREDSFGLTPLALRTSGHANGVSELHGAVSRAMWQGLWPGTEAEDVAIGHVTNAVHARSWVSRGLQDLLADVGIDLDAGPTEQGWGHALELDPHVLWTAHSHAKARLLDVISKKAVGGHGFTDDALTIGFARRFAPYKRAALLFSDAARFFELIAAQGRPIQLVFAGKAYPTDLEGKKLIAEVVRVAGSREAAGRIAFLPDYDMELAEALVQGVDVWLNNPRRPEEASGTSGMKAAMNGILNLSVLDGWWPEAYSPEVGWAVPEEISAQGDGAEADELLRLLEERVAPAFYDRDADGLPGRWLDMMRASIAAVGSRFNSARMVAEYVERFYLPAHAARGTERSTI
jgi:glycogen phosphorylase